MGLERRTPSLSGDEPETAENSPKRPVADEAKRQRSSRPPALPLRERQSLDGGFSGPSQKEQAVIGARREIEMWSRRKVLGRGLSCVG